MAESVPETVPAAICIGEAMIMLAGEPDMPLEDVDTFRRSVGGAECNVAGGRALSCQLTCWSARAATASAS